MGVDISGYGNAGMAHVLGDDIHLDPRFPGGGGVLVALAVAQCPAVAVKKIISRRKLTRAELKNLALVRLAKKTRKQ